MESQQTDAQIAYLANLLASIEDAVLVSDERFILTDWNRAAEEIYGWKKAEVLGRSGHDVLRSEFIGVTRAAAQAALIEQGRLEVNLIQYHRDGQPIWIESRALMLKAADGHSTGYVSVNRDITRRKQAEEAQGQQAAQFRAIFENAGIGMALVDLAGHPVSCNPALERFLGYRQEELARLTFADFTHPEDVEADLELFRSLLAGERENYQLEKRFIRKDGQTVWGRLTASIARNLNVQQQYGIGMVEDITAHKQAELEKDRAYHLLNERVKELGTLHRTGQILQAEDKSALEVLQELVAILPTGWQYPDITAARIAFDGLECRSPNFAPSPWQQRAEFHTSNGKTGVVEIIYLEERPAEVEGPFFAEERNLINTLAEMLRTCVERRQAKAQIQRQLEHLVALHNIDATITSSLDLYFTLNALLEQVIAQLGVDAADILLLNPYAHTLDYAAGRGFRSPVLQHTHLPLGAGYAGRAALERRLIHVANVSTTGGDLARALQLATEAFSDYYGAPLIAKGQVKGVLELFHRAPLDPDEEWLRFLDTLADQAAIAIDNLELFENLQRSTADLALAYETTLEGWVHALDLRDKETEGHTQRVTELTQRLALTMGLVDGELIQIRRGALLHDIGKLGIPDSILLKPGPLTDEEWVIMRRHPIYAHEWLSPIAYLRLALDIPYCHHEKWDGGGYPRGLKSEQIPLAARIFAIVDVWDALRSDRPYRPAWPEARTRDHIRSLSGTHFDPQVVEAFFQILREIGDTYDSRPSHGAGP